MQRLVGCSDIGDTSRAPTVENQPPPVVTDPTAVFDGTTCTYDGPDPIAGGGIISVTFQNSSDIEIDAGLFRIRNENSLRGAFDQIAPRERSGIALGIPPGSVQEGWLQAAAGGGNQEGLLLPAGCT